jgi:hypothetical protein
MVNKMREETEKRESAPHNAAMEARGAEAHEQKTVTDTPSLGGGETWAHPTGHSGTPAAWATSAVIMAAFAAAGAGLLWQVPALLWTGVAVTVVAAVVGLSTRVWSDYSVDR